jgi:hypothetical protein
MTPFNKSESATDQDWEFLKCIFEQNWLHAKHVENERLWFTNLYVAIAVGVLAFLAGNHISISVSDKLNQIRLEDKIYN